MATLDVIRLLIVEDEPQLRESLRLLLGGEPSMRVLAACGSAEEALKQLDHEAPDVVLCDLGLPKMSGIELIRRAQQRLPNLPIMVHTISEDRDAVFAALKAGACGYIVKGASPRELIEALVTLRAGGAPMSPRIARLVVRTFHERPSDDEFLLSAKERSVLLGIQDGRSYKEIALDLHISPHTVHSHIKRIYEKLQASDKQDAVMKARRRGIL